MAPARSQDHGRLRELNEVFKEALGGHWGVVLSLITEIC